MSNYTPNTPYSEKDIAQQTGDAFDLNFVKGKIQECIDAGLDDDEVSICNHVRYWVANVVDVKATYSKMAFFWKIEFTICIHGQEYHYKFSVKSNQ